MYPILKNRKHELILFRGPGGKPILQAPNSDLSPGRGRQRGSVEPALERQRQPRSGHHDRARRLRARRALRGLPVECHRQPEVPGQDAD